MCVHERWYVIREEEEGWSWKGGLACHAKQRSPSLFLEVQPPVSHQPTWMPMSSSVCVAHNRQMVKGREGEGGKGKLL